MTRPPQLVESYDRANQSDASSDLSEIFSDNGSDSDSSSDPDLDSEDSDDEDEPDNDTFDNEGQLPPEHYLAQAESLDVSQLRQKRYSNGTQERLDKTCMYWNRYCQHISVDPVQHWQWISDSNKTVRFLYAFFGWRCDIHRGKNSCHCPGIAYKSSLESFWKWWYLVLKQETSSGLSKDITIKVIAMVAKEKDLELDRKPKKSTYIEDVAEFARVLLTTTEMIFDCGWQQIQLFFFCQLAAITASRPGALLYLRYQDIALTLIRDPEGERPQLFIYLKPDFIKRFLGKKAANKFKIPEIIFDLTLVLSPHVCLLSMLFHIQGFKRISETRPVLDCPEKLYSLGILHGKGQQELKLKDEILDNFMFCQVERRPTGYRIDLEKGLTASTVRSWMRRGGKITGFNQITRPYLLRYAGAKQFNSSEEHSNMRTFVRHYKVDVDIDIQGIIRKTGSESSLVRFACLLSTLIDPDQPYKLSPKESKSLNELPVDNCKAKFERAHVAFQTTFSYLQRYNKAVYELRNKKQQQRNQRIQENLELYQNKQPVIDLEQQLAGKLVDTKVIDALEHKGSMPPQHLIMIDVMLSMPGATLEAEFQRRINVINAMTVFCPVEEGQPTPRSTQSCHHPVALRQAMESVQVNLLTRYFLRKHINPPWPARGVECNICGMELLAQKADLLNHAELCHGTVVRGQT
ncbi:hypothetical protein BDV12DRAFT_175830 [Aspergillus spectabilis]